MKLCIKVNKESSPIIQEHLFSKGFTWPEGQRVYRTEHKFLGIHDDKKLTYGNITYGYEVGFNELCDLLSKPQIKIAGYDVELMSNSSGITGIKVGCETITLEEIRTLNKWLCE